MSKFPLYDNFSKDLPKGDLTISQKKLFIKYVQTMNNKGCELIYALIRMHQIENSEQNTSYTLPYGGSFINTEIIFDLSKLPLKLRQILFKFSQAHIKNMKEEKSKQNNIKRI